MKCPTCGGNNAREALACAYCEGALVPASLTNAQLLGEIKASPEYADRDAPARHARLPKPHPLHTVAMTVILWLFIGGSAFMAVTMLGVGGVFGLAGIGAAGPAGGAFAVVPILMSIVPAGFVVIGIFGLRHVRRKMKRLEHDPVVAFAAIVVDKRTHVSGGGQDRSTSTEYFVTFESEDGERQEVQVWDGQLYGRLTADDGGILYIRAGYGLDFDRVVSGRETSG